MHLNIFRVNDVVITYLTYLSNGSLIRTISREDIDMFRKLGEFEIKFWKLLSLSLSLSYP